MNIDNQYLDTIKLNKMLCEINGQLNYFDEQIIIPFALIGFFESGLNKNREPYIRINSIYVKEIYRIYVDDRDMLIRVLGGLKKLHFDWKQTLK